MGLKELGMGRILKDERTGRLVVDKTSLRRQGRFAGEDEDLGDDDSEDEDELGDDEELGDDDLGEDDLGEEDEAGDELGAASDRRRRRRARRGKRKDRREDRREGGSVKWGKTVLGGESNTPDSVGDQITITVRPQHWFKAQDITFSGDNAAKIDTIFFGEKPIWNNSTGIPVGVFASSGMLRGILNGQKIRPGLDIIIRGTAGTANVPTTATLIGYKPLNRDC